MKTARIVNDVVLYFSFCFLAGSGILLKFSFVKGAGAQTVLSLGKKAWETCHLWVGIVATVAFILHFAMNSRFFKNALKTRAAYILFLVLGFGAGALLAVWPTTRVPAPESQQASAHRQVANK